MRRTHLAVQTAIVLAMVSLVSWPQFRSLRAESVWRYVPSTMQQTQADEIAGLGTDPNAVVGIGRAGYISGRTGITAAPTDVPHTDIDRALAPTPLGIAALGGSLNALVGFARTSQLAPIPYARIVLRNIV